MLGSWEVSDAGEVPVMIEFELLDDPAHQARRPAERPSSATARLFSDF